ncbi:MAG: hypothetical protein IJ214_08955 [Clostridia bacterium]|nr:hypothetical protein [Clostridia bacterium]
MQKNNANKNKNKNTPVPVYKPYLRGNMVSLLAFRRGLRVFSVLVLFAILGVLASGVFAFDSAVPRLLLNGVLLLLGGLILFNEGSRYGESDVSFGEIALKRQNEGKEATAKDRDTCYHPGKGFVSALLGAAPFLLVAIAYALTAEKQTYSLGTLPGWVQSFESRDDIGPALAYYHESVPVGVAGYLRIIVRLVLFPYMNMFGAGDYNKLYLLDKLSPLLTLVLPLCFGLGYLRGPHLRALVHGNIRLARRRQNRQERKAREQRVNKSNQKKELI